MRWMQKHILDFSIRHVHFKCNVLAEVFMIVLDMSLYLALKTVGVNGLWFMTIWIVAIGDGTSIDVLSFLCNEVETVVATEGGRDRLDIVFLVL